MQILTANHWPEVGDIYGKVGGRIEGVEGYYNPIERATVLTNTDLWELPESKLPSKEHTWTGLWLLAYA